MSPDRLNFILVALDIISSPYTCFNISKILVVAVIIVAVASATADAAPPSLEKNNLYCFFVQSTVKLRFTNTSDHEKLVYEQNFQTQSALDDVLCIELQTRKPSTSWSNKLGVSVSAVFVEE
jgi:hypothetical protein